MKNWDYSLLLYLLVKLLSFIFFILILLLCVALLTVWERKILGLIQRRKGPNVVGYCGLLQPFSDGLKLFLKECVIPSRSNKYLFIFAPVLAMTLSFMLWSIIPVGTFVYESDNVFLFWNLDEQQVEDYDFNASIYVVDTFNYFDDFKLVLEYLKKKGIFLNVNEQTVNEVVNFFYSLDNYAQFLKNCMGSFISEERSYKDSIYLGSLLQTDIGLLMVLSILSLNTYPVILGGWASNSKYAFLGALRASAQMISYEIAMSLTILPICVVSGSANLNDIIEVQQGFWNIFAVPLSFILFFICVLAETYRTPFDFTEAEGELVSGFNVEYSSMGFALFFLAEYLNIIFMCVLMSILFFGGFKVYVVMILLFFIILIRGTLPRYRYDQLMRLGWRIVMPISVFYLVIVSFVYFFFFKCVIGCIEF